MRIIRRQDRTTFINQNGILNMMYKKRCNSSKDSSSSSSKKNQNENVSYSKVPGKKGQVTIFIILGIILLLAVTLILVLRSEILPKEEVFATDKGKIEHFMTSCIERLGEEALFRLGVQGGYVNVPSNIANDGNLHLRTSPFQVVPYWAYGENKDIPPLEIIEREINIYIEKNLRDCLFQTENFQETYDFQEKSKITANTQALETKVAFDVHWDIELSTVTGEVVATLVDHTGESPIKLKKVYDTATTIIEKELSQLKVEDITQDLLALEHPKVPLAGFEMSCSQKKWNIGETKKTLQDMLRINLHELKISGTEYVEFPNELPYYQNHYIWNMGPEFRQSDISVLFNYDNSYPFAFNVDPQYGGVLKSGPFGGNSDLLSFLCMQSWKFVYDISYPVLVDIRDDSTGYKFKTAFTVHIQNNYPDRSGIEKKQPTFFSDTLSDDVFCQDSPVPITVFTTERIYNNEGVDYSDILDGVDITFSCLQYGCEIGETEYNFGGMGDVSALRTNFPYCVGGILRGKKEGYKDDWKRVVTRDDAEIDLELTPLIKIPGNKIEILKHNLIDEVTVGARTVLTGKETALISLKHFRDGQTEVFHETNFVYAPNLDAQVQHAQELELLGGADFTYILKIDVLDNDKFIGGYQTNWTVPIDDIENADNIIFHVIGNDKASDIELFDLFSNIEKNSLLISGPEIE
jgi:hypothetical protein